MNQFHEQSEPDVASLFRTWSSSVNEKRRLLEPFREPFGFVYFGAIVIGVNTQCSAGENKLEAKAVLSSPVTVKRTNTSTQTTLQIFIDLNIFHAYILPFFSFFFLFIKSTHSSTYNIFLPLVCFCNCSKRLRFENACSTFSTSSWVLSKMCVAVKNPARRAADRPKKDFIERFSRICVCREAYLGV